MANSHDNGLTGMRVIATFFIAIFHFELSYKFINDTRIFGTAYLFVEFFFILSGFLFAAGMVSGRHSNDSFSTVVKDRIVRLYPAYLAGLLLLPTVYALAWYGGNYWEWLTDGHIWDFFIDSLMLQSTGLSEFQYVNGPAWYVSALFLSTILAFLYIRYIGNKYLCFLISLASYVFIWIFESPGMSSGAFVFTYVPVPLLRGIGGVFLGITCYYVYEAIKGHIQEMSTVKLSVIELIAFALVLRLVLFRTTDWYNILIILPFAVLVVIMFSCNRGIVSAVLSHRYWGFFSDISYSFYITQSFCSNVFTCILTNVDMPLVFIWYLILNLAVAIFIHFLIEKPVLSWYKQKSVSNKQISSV